MKAGGRKFNDCKGRFRHAAEWACGLSGFVELNNRFSHNACLEGYISDDGFVKTKVETIRNCLGSCDLLD